MTIEYGFLIDCFFNFAISGLWLAPTEPNGPHNIQVVVRADTGVVASHSEKDNFPIQLKHTANCFELFDIVALHLNISRNCRNCIELLFIHPSNK